MSKINCKICGGKLNLPEGITAGECPYCGTTTTFPKISGKYHEQLYNRAEEFRRLCNFDKAISCYDDLIREMPDDAESHWGMVLARFGIEYVEDPLTQERKPTCHRVQQDSIQQDTDYREALRLAPEEAYLYEQEANRIAEIQNDILRISNQEAPYDIFICCKETDDAGQRTQESEAAQEIYHLLTNEGYKVFFARITLENKLDCQYEPYIFAALNSAKVMLVIGTKKEFFEAVWVRNEWSRFLHLAKKDTSKLLIPCYRAMDASDLPQEISMFQSLDMGKIVFIQDLLRGVKKALADKNEITEEKKQNIKTLPRTVINQLLTQGISRFKKKKFLFISVLSAILLLSSIFLYDPFIYIFSIRPQAIKQGLQIKREGKEKITITGHEEDYSDNITIPSGVTHIGKSAFEQCRTLKSVTIPNSVKTIGNFAFSECEKLKKITIPNSVKTIGNFAFSECSNLRSVTIPNSVKSIGTYAFSNCQKLHVELPENIDEIGIGKYAFQYVKSVTVRGPQK